MFSAVARSARIVNSLEQVLGGKIAFFHSKLTLKRPKIGGAWDWHQDYGYWYRNGYFFPHMASVFLALDPSKKINGCLQVLKGSHHLGRIEHGINKDQVGADMMRVEHARKCFDLVEVEMDPGDALFFHCNLLHASGKNNSDQTRNVLLSCYNRADNPPFIQSPGNGHTLFETLPDSEVMGFSDRPLDHNKNFHDGGKRIIRRKLLQIIVKHRILVPHVQFKMVVLIIIYLLFVLVKILSLEYKIKPLLLY